MDIWNLPDSFNSTFISILKYTELLFRAVHEVLQPLVVIEDVLKNWIFSEASYLLPPGFLHYRLEMPLFAGLKRVRVHMS
jgi:hypothetical protein